MSTKRSQVRYTTEEQIIHKIDALIAQRAASLAEAIGHDELITKAKQEIAEMLNKHGGDLSQKERYRFSELRKAIEDNKKLAEIASKKWHRIEDVSLPKMKQLLAAFRTGLLIGDDPGVVAA